MDHIGECHEYIDEARGLNRTNAAGRAAVDVEPMPRFGGIVMLGVYLLMLLFCVACWYGVYVVVSGWIS